MVQVGTSTLLCSFVIWYWIILPISFRIISLALIQLHNSPSACEVIVKDMG